MTSQPAIARIRERMQPPASPADQGSRETPTGDEPMLYHPQTGEKVEPPLALIARKTAVEIVRIRRIGRPRSRFYFTGRHRRTGAEVEFGPVESDAVLEPRRMRRLIWDALGGRPIKKFTDADWAEIADAIDEAAEFEDHGGSDAETWQHRIARYAFERSPYNGLDPNDPAVKAEIIEHHDCVVSPDGRVWVHRDSLAEWLSRACRISITADEVATELTHLGFGNKQLTARTNDGKTKSRRYWFSPLDFLDAA
jgi:hypothetical protein